MEWVRLYHDMPTDPKWRVIATRAQQRIGDVIAVYVFVLCNASGNTVERGVTHGFVAEDVAAALDLQEGCVTAILEAMEGKVLKNGALLGWEKRNPKREDSSTERVRKHRETQRNAEKRPDKSREEENIISSLRSDITPPADEQSKPKRKVTTSLPENFPDPEAFTAACEYWTEKGRPDLAEARLTEAQKFRDHHAAHGSRMVDWRAAWRTWCSNALRFNRAQPQFQQSWKPIKVA